MSKLIDIDFTLTPSDEARICFNCTKKKCTCKCGLVQKKKTKSQQGPLVTEEFTIPEEPPWPKGEAHQ